MRKFWKIFLIVILSVLLFITVALLAGVITVYALYSKAEYPNPGVNIDRTGYVVDQVNDSLRTCNGNTMFLNQNGLWEVVVGGSPEEMGANFGALNEDLLYYQEEVFVKQLQEMIPSDKYLNFLRILVIVFNRNLTEYVPQEYLKEIYAISEFCSDDFDMVGEPYLRQLNFHAAHDIGHIMQGYMLVACSSFGVWDDCSEDGCLLIGRNFDFYMGDDFAKNKIVLFARPDSGYDYASVTWPGMIGVMSGMNEKGLTVTINASKGSLPTSSALPISLLARNILQYAENIEEAYNIALSAETFVSESLLIGSASDGCAAIIEKTPENTVLYRSESDNIKCTNHYQSDFFADDKYNQENISTTDSKYRFDRLTELIDGSGSVSTDDAASILRNRYGLDDKDIGYTNQKSINLSNAHHSVIFQPEKLRMWVSTSPWQSGPYICYDLKSVFSGEKDPAEGLSDKELTIGADEKFMEEDYENILKYRKYASAVKKAIKDDNIIDDSIINNIILSNPEYYETYNLCGDYMLKIDNEEAAVDYWKTALNKEIPYLSTIEEINKKIKKHDKR